ncbi:MAG: inositol monophosphatase [Holosporales bacterium]|jgi:myo-inositol-1(or 4)-monophosphatase|nr:inositol monophosphatase [Holosporales bacterium]
MFKAAEKAAFSLVRDFGELEKLQVSRKGFKNFVTSADKNSESKIIYELSKARAGFSFICEESGSIPGEKKDSIWIVDPIDGTNNFMRGIPYFAINIALMENDEFVSGLTLDPMRRDCFKAEIGNGAFLGNRNRIRVSGREDIEESVIVTRTSGAIDLKIVELGAILRKTGSLALDLAYLSAGKYDAVIAEDVMIWDIASGVVLVKESGGFIRYNKKENGKYDVIATSSLKLLESINRILKT